MGDKALADAINNLADAIHKLADYDRIGHEICVGIRHGLFGNGDSSNSIERIFDGLEHQADRIADAVESLGPMEESVSNIAAAVISLDNNGIVTYGGNSE